MIDASHFSAVGFILFIGFVAYKKFFGLSDFLSDGISKIQHDIDDAESQYENAQLTLSAAQEKASSLGELIKKLEADSQLTLDTLTKHKAQELTIFEDQLRKRHDKIMHDLEQSYQRQYRDAFTQQLMAHMKQSLALQAPGDLQNQLRTALDLVDHSTSEIRAALSDV